MTKFLILLITLISYINYENFIQMDIPKIQRKIENLKITISREKVTQEQNHTKESLMVNYTNFIFDGTYYSYSKAMGSIQNQINQAAKDKCQVKSIKWAQVPSSEIWYDKLKMNIRLECTPNKLIEVTNELKNNNYLYNIENFIVNKHHKKEILSIRIQLIAYRTNNADK